MPLYHYEALDKRGEKVIGSMQVADEQILSQRLETMGYEVAAVHPAARLQATAATPAARATERARPVSHRVMARFFEQLSVSLKAGIPAFQALSQVAMQTPEVRFREVLQRMTPPLQHGERLSEQMARFPALFQPSDVGLVRASELGGFMPEALHELSQAHVADDRIQRLCMLPFIYTVCLGLLALLITIPAAGVSERVLTTGKTIEGLYAALERFLYVSLPILVGVIAGLFVFRWLIRHPRLKREWHGLLLKVPPFSQLHYQRSRATFAGCMRFLYHAGVGMPQAWEAAARAVPNLRLADRLLAATPALERGAPLSHALQQTGLFSAGDVGAITTGEQTGELEAMLSRVADTNHEDAERTVRNFPVVSYVFFFVVNALMVGSAVIYAVYHHYSGILRAFDSWGES